MRQSDFFTKTRKEEIKEEESLNARLLLKAGFINKEIAGVYSFLPLGWMVLKNIEEIIRDEMKNTLGAQEIFMPALHPLENYKITGRDNIDVLFHTELKGGGKLVLGQSHEEIIVPLFRRFISSYKDLPCGAFQIQTKFRNELRAKSGILRGREFIMKDLYSFHASEDDLYRYYEKAKEAYHNIFRRLGIGDRTYLTFASGGSFSQYSHEFQTLTEAGEDDIYLCKECNIAVNKGIITEQASCPECGTNKEKLENKKAIEVGNIFPLHRRFSDPFGLTYKDENGEDKGVFMGCYGIGLNRAMGAVVEVLADKKGLVWPWIIAPFKVHLLSLEKELQGEAEKIYAQLADNGIDVLFDDREKSPGEKLVESDLLGMPFRVVVSRKNMEKKVVEIKKRTEENAEFLKVKEIINYVKTSFK